MHRKSPDQIDQVLDEQNFGRVRMVLLIELESFLLDSYQRFGALICLPCVYFLM